MSVESESTATEEHANVDELGRRLGNAIADLPEYEAFEEAQRAVLEDDEVQAKIQAFEEQRQAFTVARQSGEADREDLVEVQRMQQELHELPVMARFLERQAALQDRLEDVNEAISEPLVIDFGGEAGGCCHD